MPTLSSGFVHARIGWRGPSASSDAKATVFASPTAAVGVGAPVVMFSIGVYVVLGDSEA
jgi:hypothetical protein